MSLVITLAKIYAFSMLQGHDVVIQCRDEGRMRRDVYWTREGGRALPKTATMVAVLFILKSTLLFLFVIASFFSTALL